MRAVVWEGKKNVHVGTVPDPEVLNPRDAIVKVTLTAICGSDLHLYDGFIPTMKPGDVNPLDRSDEPRSSRPAAAAHSVRPSR